MKTLALEDASFSSKEVLFIRIKGQHLTFSDEEIRIGFFITSKHSAISRQSKKKQLLEFYIVGEFPFKITLRAENCHKERYFPRTLH